MTRRLSFLTGALAALCVALLLPPDTLLPGASADVTCSTVAMSCSAGGTFTGGTITSPILTPAADNCASVPYSFTGDTDSGFCSPSAGITAIVGDAATVLAFQNGTVYVPSGTQFLFTDGSYGGTHSSFWGRGTTGTIWQRSSPSFQQPQEYHWTYSWTDASNYQGGVLKTSASGIEIAAETAGSGADNLDVTITPAGTGGVILQAYNGGYKTLTFTAYGSDMAVVPTNDSTQLGIGALAFHSASINRAIQGSKTKALTESSATTFVTVAVPQTAGANYAAGKVIYTVYASDGTDSQSLNGVAQFSAVNKAGTETCAAIADVQTAVAESAGGSTLTCTITCVTGLTDVVGLAANCVSSLTQTTLQIQARLDMDQPNTLVFP